MNDPDLIRMAAAAAGLSARRLAEDVLGVDERNMRRWETGEREVQGTARVVCAAIIARPELAGELAHVRAKLSDPPAKLPRRLESGAIIADVPPGVHPWAPAEEEYAAAIEPVLEAYLDLSRRCLEVGNDLIARAMPRSTQFDVIEVHSLLLVRVLQDLRASVILALSGYPMQCWAVAGSAFEAAHHLGFIGASHVLALEWLTHKSDTKPFRNVFDSVKATFKYLGVASDPAELEALTQGEYRLYEQLCMGKHANPISERERYVYLVDAAPNLVLSPKATPSRVGEARLGLLLALRSVHIALWVFDVTNSGKPGLVDERIASIAEALDELREAWDGDMMKLRASGVLPEAEGEAKSDALRSARELRPPE